jgi:membrane protein
VSIGFLLLVTLAVSAAVKAATAWFGSLLPVWPVVVLALDQLIGLLVTTALFAILFRVLPDVALDWSDVMVGALVTALLFAAGQRLIGLYLGHSALASPFGAAGTVAIILVWVYYSAQIVLLGAEFTHQWARARHGEPAALPGATHTAPARA